MEIRFARPDDYSAIAEIHNAAEPPGSMQDDAESLKHLDALMDKKYRMTRYVGVVDGRTVATARASMIPQWYHPQRFSFYIAIRPADQGKGYGKAIYDRIREDLAPHSPIALRAFYSSECPRSERFLKDRGLSEDMRMWESWVDTEAFDSTPYDETIKKVLSSGIRVCTLPEIKQAPDWEQKLYDFIVHIQRDMPSTEEYTPISFEFFQNVEMGRPTIVPEAYFMAVDGDRYAGASILHKEESDPTRMNTDDTGVHRDYRRRGIATALKVIGLTYAKTHGIKRVYTMNESTNQPMLALNIALGFQQMPPRIGMILDLV